MSRIAPIFALLFALPASAATLQQLSVPQMTQAATSIVRARVVSAGAALNGNTIYTHYRLQVTESWKGFTPSEVAIPGGIANGVRQSFPGMPQLTVGAEYVMFLWTSGSTGITHLVGLQQGLFNLSAQADGSTLAVRPLIGEMLLDASGRKVADQAVQMNISTLKANVRSSLVGGLQ